MTYNALLISDSFDHAAPANRQKGATTRLMERVFRALGDNHGARVSFHGLKPDYESLMSLNPDAPTVALLVHNQDERMLDVALHLAEKNVPVFVHMADPHLVNKSGDPQAPTDRRADLHRDLYTLAAGVIASSDANRQLVSAVNSNSLYIPNPFDADNIAPARGAWAQTSGRYLHWASASYPMHQAGLYEAARAFAALNEQGKTAHVYTIVTAAKKLTERLTHAALSSADYLTQLQAMAQSHPWLQVEGAFTPDLMAQTLRGSDLVIIPRDPPEEMTAYQTFWQEYRAPTRIIDALAHGCLPVAQTQAFLAHGPFPEPHQRFIDAGAVVTYDTTEDMIHAVRAMDSDEAKTRIEKGQEILLESHTPAKIAAQHHAAYIAALG